MKTKTISDKIFNRRADDLVISIKIPKNPTDLSEEVLIEYLNYYASWFFGLSFAKLAKGKLKFIDLLSGESRNFFKEYCKEYQNNPDNLEEFFRNVRNFQLLDRNKQQKFVHIKSFPFCTDSKDSQTICHYLVIRNVDLFSGIYLFRKNLLQKGGTSTVNDQDLEIPNIASTISETKMLAEFVKSRKDTLIALAMLEFDDEKTLADFVKLFKMRARSEDFIGIFGLKQLLIYFIGISSNIALKPISRIFSILNFDNPRARMKLSFIDLNEHMSYEQICNELKLQLRPITNSGN